MAIVTSLRLRLAAGCIAAAAVTAGCGTPVTVPTATPAPTPAPTPDRIALGQAYIKAMVPVDQAIANLTAFGEQTAAHPPTQAQVTAAAAPVITAIQQCQAILAATSWPASAGNDITALNVQLHLLLADLQTVTPATLQSSIPADVHGVLRAKSKVSLELGLPGL